ncbi:peptidase S8/S53 domain-containing protein [Trichoderma chlorosporum]
MASFKQLALLLLAVSPCVIASPPFNNARQGPIRIPGLPTAEEKYIVTLEKNISPAQFKSHVEQVNATYRRNSINDEQNRPSGVERTYTIGDYRAYSGIFDKSTIESLWDNPLVADIEPDAFFTVERKVIEQRSAPWGLATLSSKKRGGKSYRYDESAGNGTYVYVIDSGINTKHIEFEGRASVGYSVVGKDLSDSMGHGTHVAGIIGGKTFGVAKKTQLIGIKVFSNGGAMSSDIIDGLQWAVRDIIAKARQNRAVINMSLGGAYSFALNSAVDAAFDKGVLSVVAAGNEASPARLMSPASAGSALTVGAINPRWEECNFSNYGPEVNIQAPGYEIESAYIATDNATAILSGTSMAAPHVAGLAAYLMALEQPDSVQGLKNRILKLGIKGKAKKLAVDTPNLIAHNAVHKFL